MQPLCDTTALIKINNIKAIEKLKFFYQNAIDKKNYGFSVEMLKELFELIGIKDVDVSKRFDRDGEIKIGFDVIDFIANDTVFIYAIHNLDLDKLLELLSKSNEVKIWAFTHGFDSADANDWKNLYGYFNDQFNIFSFYSTERQMVTLYQIEVKLTEPQEEIITYLKEVVDEWYNSIPLEERDKYFKDTIKDLFDESDVITSYGYEKSFASFFSTYSFNKC